jgi:hypothetical protein
MRRVNTSIRPIELLGLAMAGGALPQRQALEERHDVHAALLQHRAGMVEVELVHGERGDLVLDRRRRAGQEARSHTMDA